MGVAIGAVGVSLLEFWYFWWNGWSLFDWEVRGGDLTGGSQWLSVYVVMGFPWLLFSLNRISSWRMRAGFALGLVVLFLGLWVSHTRAALVAVGAQLVTYFCLRMFRRGWVAAGCVVLLVSIVFGVSWLPEKYQDRFFASTITNPLSLQIRLNTWMLAAQDVVAQPLLGLGYGKHSFHKVHPDWPPEVEPVHLHIHNTFYAKMVQIGLPGFLLFVWIFGRLIKIAYALYQNAPTAFSGKFALSILVMTVGLIVRNLFDDMLIGTVAYLFWLVAGLLVWISCWGKPERWQSIKGAKCDTT
ncbi:MAG: O-antigen ligase domain-containing protein [Nitrospirae bacterium]|nr:MAG: O-antigen ligase domain-containing protein [Nitrospirota bacterium]